MIQAHSKLIKLHPSSNGKPHTTVLLVITVTLSICLVTPWIISENSSYRTHATFPSAQESWTLITAALTKKGKGF
ncbi:UNVERIFIED_CONTAM: hypothetical protein K2H54_017429 [Gekko kuhli]